ncbi:MAG: hypothetical protein J0L84_20805, partial [Verrucomicrobia bacterium]|nr:hypothetical protein [Verrucomicrobiota bacterium]
MSHPWKRWSVGWLAGWGGALVGFAAEQQPTAWRAVECDSARPYRGPALRDAPDLRPVFDNAGTLDGALPQEIVRPLEAAFTRALEATRAPAMSVAVGIPGRGLWSATRLGTNTPGIGVPPRWFWAASVGKSFT